MPIENLGHEYEFEPEYGLPERLPSDEFIVWQGSPDVATLASSAFHIKKLVVYFAVLIVACAWPALEEGAGVMAVLLSIKWIAPLTLIGLGSVWLMAYMTSRTTVYTLTNKRVVMRLGIVFTVSFNFPLKQVASADVRMLKDGFGDITLALKGSDRIAWIHLWPSVRPWKVEKPEPTLRAIPNVQEVSVKLSEAWTHNTGLPVNATSSVNTGKPSSNDLQVSLT
ncbi:photosynthetic complex putative assembly protein PuhB [uncultured Limnohabitans sp.]|uniref:photosynthetic complex putative assembly protein PuhB n=1 Tax=uncultured Limnohabitans sp. TaxID=768543 RepID=UPI0026185F9C|nr:photosynthetic complex putative assembly protein PuhB [uncultured Limnohabitans sp.]